MVALIVLTAVQQCFAATYLTSDGFYYLPDDKYNATVYGCNDNKTELVFPDRLDNYNVRSIADYSFINNGNITSIDFTNAKYLRSVGYLSFQVVQMSNQLFYHTGLIPLILALFKIVRH